MVYCPYNFFFFFQAEDGIRDLYVTGVQTCALPICSPRLERPATAPELEKRWQALKDERTALEDRIGAEAARKKFAERFASETPFGLGEKGEARPLADWRAAFGAVADEIRAANDAIRALRLKQRDLDHE